MEEKIKRGYVVNYILGGLIFIGALLFMLLHKSVSSYIVKTIPSVLFVLCGLFNYIYCSKVLKVNAKSNKYALFIVCGLFFAMLGDIFLIDAYLFVVGAAFFALGHILFFISFCFIAKFRIRDFVVGGIIFGLAALFIWLYPYFDLQGMGVLIVIYALIISLMLGKAISNFISDKKSIVYILVLLGAGLFFFSDLMLLMFRFAHRFMIFDWLCVMTYYPAEFLLAFSIFIASIVKKNNEK